MGGSGISELVCVGGSEIGGGACKMNQTTIMKELKKKELFKRSCVVNWIIHGLRSDKLI